MTCHQFKSTVRFSKRGSPEDILRHCQVFLVRLMIEALRRFNLYEISSSDFFVEGGGSSNYRTFVVRSKDGAGTRTEGHSGRTPGHLSFTLPVLGLDTGRSLTLLQVRSDNGLRDPTKNDFLTNFPFDLESVSRRFSEGLRPQNSCLLCPG